MKHETLEDLKIESAAKDPDLVALFELEIYDTTSAVSPGRADLIEAMEPEDVLQLRCEIRRAYDLSESMMERAITRCIANVAGINLGEVFFKS